MTYGAIEFDLSRLCPLVRQHFLVYCTAMPTEDRDAIVLHIHDLALLPEAFYFALFNAGLTRIVAGAGCVSDFPGYAIAAQVPVPTRPGESFTSVPCAYDRASKVVLLGTRPAHPLREAPSPALHELGHAAGDLLGYDNSVGVRSEYARLLPQLPPALIGSSLRNETDCIREFFAQSVEHVILETDLSRWLFSREYRELIQCLVSKGAAAAEMES